jgi:hypothetical protein
VTHPTPLHRDQNATLTSDPWRHLRQTLAWQHGSDRAASILAGADLATNLDLAAWRSLGGAK